METREEKNKNRKKAIEASRKHKSLMKGKKVILIPHPTVPKTFIEKIIDDDQD